MIRKLLIGTMAAALVTGASVNIAAAKDKIKIALIEGLSGPFAASGQAALRELKYGAEKYIANDKLDVEVIGLDGKTSPKETLVQLKNALSQGVTYVVQGNSSGVAHALVSAIDKHNERNPTKRVLFLNHSAVDPALTEKKCSFWHFRFDAHVGMKLQAMIGALAADKSIKKVYIIGQDYSYGKAVAGGTVAFLKALRPDIKVVGNELHPIGKVKDFTPYVKKIQTSGADAVVTGNWGADMVGLALALGAADVKAKVFTFYAAGTGVTATIGKGGEGRILVVTEGKSNPMSAEQLENWKAFKAKYPDQDVLYSRITTLTRMLGEAITKAGSAKPFDVAKALEGAKIKRLDGTEATMRAKDHQLTVGLYLMAHTSKLPTYDEKLKNDFDKSGFGLVSVAHVPGEKAARPVKCTVKAPKK